MGKTFAINITCDGDDCSACADPGGSMPEARAQAKREGFVRRKIAGKWVDLCKDCAAKPVLDIFDEATP